MMNANELAASAAALGNQMKAGISTAHALRRLVAMQPKYSEFWTRAALAVESGRPLSESLSELWPTALVSAVKAGERSGRLEDVFGRVEETIQLQQSLRGTMMKLAYPFAMGFAGLAVFLGFMVFVLPSLSRAISTNSRSFVFELSTWMARTVLDNWVILTASMVVGTMLFVAWIRTEEARTTILEFALDIPVLKDALRDMYFGLWANYMAMMVASGITTIESLRLTGVILPSGLKNSVQSFEQDLAVNNRSMSDAADLSLQTPGDQRTTWWPFYISNAFIVAEQTGEVDRELLRVAPSLIKEGVKTLETVIAIANVFALALAAALIVSPLAAYYIEIFDAIRQAGR